MACMHISTVTCPECLRFDNWQPKPVWTCNHCYCQPGKNVGGVQHVKCCKCSDEHAVGAITVT